MKTKAEFARELKEHIVVVIGLGVTGTAVQKAIKDKVGCVITFDEKNDDADCKDLHSLSEKISDEAIKLKKTVRLERVIGKTGNSKLPLHVLSNFDGLLHDIHNFNESRFDRVREFAKSHKPNGLHLPGGLFEKRNKVIAVISPGVKPDSEIVEYCKDRDIKIFSDVDFAYMFSKCFRTNPLYWVGITGTDGKTSVTTLTNEILNKCDLTAKTVGNIGTPPFEYVFDEGVDVLVCETSSFQLHYSKVVRFDVSVCLNVDDDHSSWHGSFENYFRDKVKIHRGNKHISLANYDNEMSYKTAIELSCGAGCETIFYRLSKPVRMQIGIECFTEEKSGSKKPKLIPIDDLSCLGEVGARGNADVRGNAGARESLKVSLVDKTGEEDVKIDLSEYKDLFYVGDKLLLHNLENIVSSYSLASGAVKTIGAGEETRDSASAMHDTASVTYDASSVVKALIKTLDEFKFPEHRFEYIKTEDNVCYIDDSKATNVHSSLSSLKSFGKKSIILIAGGISKGIDYTEFANQIHDKLIGLVLIGKSDEIYGAFKKYEKEIDIKRIDKSDGTENMKSGIEVAKRIAKKYNSSNKSDKSKGSAKSTGAERPKGSIKSENTKKSKDSNKASDSNNTNVYLILSPASSSHDYYKSYEERGDLFKELI